MAHDQIPLWETKEEADYGNYPFADLTVTGLRTLVRFDFDEQNPTRPPYWHGWFCDQELLARLESEEWRKGEEEDPGAELHFKLEAHTDDDGICLSLVPFGAGEEDDRMLLGINLSPLQAAELMNALRAVLCMRRIPGTRSAQQK